MILICPRLKSSKNLLAVTLVGDAEKIAEHFGAFPEKCAYELEFPVPGDLGVIE